MNGTQNNKLGVVHQTLPRISARAGESQRALAPVSTTGSYLKGKSARSPGSATLNESSRTVSSDTFILVAEANAERTRCANKIAVGPHGFDFADCVTESDRADLRPVERNHLPELAGRN